MTIKPTLSNLLTALAVLASISGCDEGSTDAIDGEFRIVGGAPTSADPAVPLLAMYDGQSDQPFEICTGTLIASDWILTAAHCAGSNVVAIGVYFGTDALSPQDPGFIHFGEVDGLSVHPAWVENGPADQGNDVALLHLSAAVPLEPIPLNRTPLSESMLGAPIHLVGWGLTTGGATDSGIKRAVESQLFGFDSMFALVGDGQTSTCNGDSGGPAFMNIGGQTVVMGVTSYGDTSCAQVGISMRVDAYAGWIDETIGVVAPGGGGGGGSGGVGDPCASGSDCASGFCVEDGQSSFCTAACSTDDDCPQGFACFATDDPSLQVCAPEGGSGEGEGESGGPGLPPSSGSGPMPGSDDDGGDEDDDSGDEDESGGDEDGGDEDDDDDDGRCSVSTSAPPPIALALVLLGALRRRRRA